MVEMDRYEDVRSTDWIVVQEGARPQGGQSGSEKTGGRANTERL